MIVIKIGGASGVNLDAVCSDVAVLLSRGTQVIIAHGGSSETNAISEQLGHPPRFVTAVSGYTSRYTDRQTLEIFAMVTSGKISTLIVENLQKNGVNAFGLSGIDGRMMVARRKEAIRIIENGKQLMLRDDFTGKIEQVNASLLFTLVSMGFTPVIAPLAISYDGDALNVDADRAAAMIAGAVNAETLVILSNVQGLLRNFPDADSLIHNLSRSEVDQALKFAEGRMKKKVLGASEALNAGVPKVVIADGRISQPVLQALDGHGTVIA
jgi:acetylglutamate/LysW-gamma-L-alpha-aminoadipate kinase